MDVARELKELMVKKPRLTLAVAESLTAGHVQVRIAAVSGASNFFLGGITAYSLEEKVKLLGVKATVARAVNSVSATVAEQMARGVCRLFGADLGVATTGYAEPDAKHGVRDPMAWWALAHRRHGAKFVLRHGRVECPGASRVDVQAIVAATVLTELTEYLREFRD